MKIATYNVNGVNGRLSVLLRWLEEAAPDIACLQELKAPHERFPEAAIRNAGYGAIWPGQRSWNGVAILARGVEPFETRRALPGDPDDTHSRYIEAAVKGVLVGCLYLPNGNPAPGPKFDYKLRWFERPGAGRKKGAAEIRTRRIANELAREGLTPLEVMVETMRGLWQQAQAASTAEERLEKQLAACAVAEKAAPYIHARLAAVSTTVRHINSVRDLSDAELVALMNSMGGEVIEARAEPLALPATAAGQPSNGKPT